MTKTLRRALVRLAREKITEAGAARASLYDEDGRPKMVEEA
jgi:hypothetical protein